nr:immunoglobulin heavy chain junction region [Mus musculus]
CARGAYYSNLGWFAYW